MFSEGALPQSGLSIRANRYWRAFCFRGRTLNRPHTRKNQPTPGFSATGSYPFKRVFGEIIEQPDTFSDHTSPNETSGQRGESLNTPNQLTILDNSTLADSRYLSACPDLDYFRLADNLSGTLVIISQKPVSGGLPVRRPAARMERLFWGVVAAPKSYRARVGIDLCSDFNEVAFRVAHHRFVVSVSSYPRTSSYGHSGCAHGSY
jgi:hypothetical protein